VNATPTAFFDKSANKVYPITLTTIIHLGANTVRVLPSDTMSHISSTKFHVLGLPSVPALFPRMVSQFIKKSDKKSMARLMAKYAVSKNWVPLNLTNMENVVHYLMRIDDAEALNECL